VTGSKKKHLARELTRKEILAAMKTPPPGGHYVWDGVDKDDRPLTREQLRTGIELARKRGRPPGSNKESTTVRFDRDVLDAFRAGGPGWQTRMNAALREWLGKYKSR
jgi:uncharacterized protein (DUF4415 family)